MEDFTEKIFKIAPSVAKILKKNVKSRDDDNLLMCLVWESQKIKPYTRFTAFKRNLVKGNFATPETITRCRRKLQEKHVELRGDNYAERHNEEEKVRNQIKLSFDF